MRAKKVYLIGAGPGKPDLITVRGMNILGEADTVIYDYLVDRSLLEYTKEGAELICCDSLHEKEKHHGRFPKRQDNINNLLVRKSKEGKSVVRLKNGNPAVFSRISEELDALSKNRIKYEIVPGVTAGSAAASLNGIPLTDRSLASSCAFVTGHEGPEKETSALDWNSLSKCGTLVLYMGVAKLPYIVKNLLKAGRKNDTPVAIVQNTSLITQKTVTGTLKDIVIKARKSNIKPPAIIIIGEVAKLERRFNWLKENKLVFFTGLSNERYFEDKIYFHLPLIKIEPMDDYRELDSYIKNIKRFDWIVFASRYGVEYFFKRLKIANLDSRVLNGIKIAAVGNSTKNRLLDFGVLADLVPKNESANGLIEEFKNVGLEYKRVFLPRSNISDKGLSEAFEKMGATTKTAFAYKNVIPKDLPNLDLNLFDEIMFTSPSTVRNFKKRYKNVPKNVEIRCIGDVTLKEAKKCRLLG
jgi:uroporphyrinogen III methyltransferase/synthase